MPCCFSTTAQPERVLQVFFACSDGSFFALCPVAPFHAAMSLSGVDQLVEISRCSADDTAHSTTQAWLDQVTQMQLQPFLPPPSPGVHECPLLHLLCDRDCATRLHVRSAMQLIHSVCLSLNKC